jgi:cystathionine gamma-synthase
MESVIAHPTTMTHARMSEDERSSAGINDSLLRVSIGLEAEEDLLSDLASSLAAASSKSAG